MSRSKGIEFCFNGGAVGQLDPGSLPESDGVIGYWPYRSASHLFLHRAIAGGQMATCTFIENGVERSFVVEAAAGYGQLRIRDLSRG